jgi:hypothetical protein
MIENAEHASWVTGMKLGIGLIFDAYHNVFADFHDEYQLNKPVCGHERSNSSATQDLFRGASTIRT